MKALLGTGDNLIWDVNQKEGAYYGHSIEDPYGDINVRLKPH